MGNGRTDNSMNRRQAAFMAYALNTTGFSIVSVCTDMELAMVFPGVFLLIAIVEFITDKMMAVWEETKINTLKAQEKARKEKEEKQERLAFEGKYNKLFYRLVLKNFKSNWKDYILLLLCSVMVFTFIVIGFGLHRILGAESAYEGMDQLFGGLNAVLKNAIIPLGINSTEQMESRDQGVPPQGQHIGISESTYHALRKSLDANYQKTDLNLDEEGEYVYIVHQQDKSIKAQPLDFYLSGENPLLHAGPPCQGVFVEFIKEDIGYYFRNIRGEEIGSLTGAFRQGLRDNLVVFSDEYFEVAKELWKTTDMYSGRQIPEDVEKIPGINIRQGPTRLVLLRTEEENIRKLEPEMAEFKARHEADEAYDRTVSCYYTKPDAVQRLKTERTMKITMNLLVLIVFFVVYLVLLAVKMATEADMTAERARFLMCMGMRRKERKTLIGKELLYYYYMLPTVISIGFSVIFTAASISCKTVHERGYVLLY